MTFHMLIEIVDIDSILTPLPNNINVDVISISFPFFNISQLSYCSYPYP